MSDLDDLDEIYEARGRSLGDRTRKPYPKLRTSFLKYAAGSTERAMQKSRLRSRHRKAPVSLARVVLPESAE